jgi:nitrate/nitrite transport system substrate-binding protein
MRSFKPPFDPDHRRHERPCSCGTRASSLDDGQKQEQGSQAGTPASSCYERAIVSTVMRAILPKEAARREFLKSVGAATALAALSQFLPINAATELFAHGVGAPEKKDLKVGFIPITCATPIIVAHPMGFYSKQGLNVEVVKTAGWAVVRDKTINGEYDAAHMLSPMPLAISLGLGSQAIPFAVPAIENINGQGITLAVKHKDKRDPSQWKGFKFAIPFDYSMHNYLLRYYLAEYGLDPDADVQLRVVPPPKWWRISARTTLTVFWRPTAFANARSTMASDFSTSCPRRSGTGIPAAASPRAGNS